MSDPNEQPAAPATLSRRHLVMGAAMLAVAGTTFARMPRRQYSNIPDKQFEDMFPKAFADWRLMGASEMILPPEGDLSAKLYQHVLTRTYKNGQGDAVMFLVAYNSEQVNNVQIHRPEICYSASGFDITDSKPYSLPVGQDKIVPARIVRAERVTRTENIIYWTRIGDEFPQTWADQRIAMTKANLKGFYADGLLVRASNIDNDEHKSVAIVSRFLSDMAMHSSASTRHLAFRA